jgi:bifunctional non-homologous end joining protein LigD
MPRKPSKTAARLSTYRAKRDFSKSPEPTGAAPRTPKVKPKAKPKVSIWDKAAPPRFCVQKHLASQLHYDFRLEHDGVLLSWAVPKGPSLRPVDKRLAMKVEDHPVEYGGFEGVIPSGYGAGVVMLWDAGSWHPELADVNAALAKGDLKFRLDGVKLKGSWALVNIGDRSGRGNGRSWLLIKHRDEWAGDIDITEMAPLSVKSFGDLPDILAADNPQVWESHRPAGGGKAGAMLQEVIAQAAARKAKPQSRRSKAQRDRPSPAPPRTDARQKTPEPAKGAPTEKKRRRKS